MKARALAHHVAPGIYQASLELDGRAVLIELRPRKYGSGRHAGRRYWLITLEDDNHAGSKREQGTDAG